jgi:2-polyprenyl-6-hydroxyphenyl methylase/3-demethylubiquinone-9 3-methyltransferase
VNNDIYNEYGDRWYTAYDDPVALLRAETRAKLPWVASRIEKELGSLEGIGLLDIGCGGGFLSNALSEIGMRVTGIDLSATSLEVARRWDKTGKVKYLEANAYRLPFAGESFDVVTAMDFLEHVEDPRKAISECARVLKPGGLFFFHTFNRNPIAGFCVIKLVEWIVANTPKNMHVLRLFLKPKEVGSYCRESGLYVKEIEGIRPRFSTIPVRSYFTGVVPEKLEFCFTRSKLLAYIGMAKKERLN